MTARLLPLELQLGAVECGVVRRWLFLYICLFGPVFLALCSSSLSSSRVEFGASLGAGVHESRCQRPVVAFAWRVILVSRDLHEAVVEGEVVADGILPAASVFPVEGEVVHDVVVYLVQC